MIRKIGLLCAIAIVFTFSFMLLEGTVVSAATATASAGFNVSLDVTDVLTLTCSQASSTFPVSIGTIGGYGNATSTENAFNCTTTSNSATGYQLGARATSSPAMQLLDGSDTIANTAKAYDIEIATNESEFGFSASTTIADYLNAVFKNDGAGNCDSTEQNNTACWNPLASTITNVVNKSVISAADGDVVKFMFKTKIGSTRNQKTGTYNAHVIIEAYNQ